MKILLLTNEYPPHVYGGAGVHVEYLSRELPLAEDGAHRLQVFCFGQQNDTDGGRSVLGIGGADMDGLRQAGILETLYRNLIMTGSAADADVVHCHTWYTYLAGCLIKQLLNIPLVTTLHSLEPHRPWKREQLGDGYRLSLWLEKTAMQNADGVIAVSRSMAEDVRGLYGLPPSRIRVIPNGIDTSLYRPVDDPAVLSAYDIDPSVPYILFVGRITRQKGIIHLVNALPHLRDGIQVVLCAGAPDTEEIAREMESRVEAARAGTANRIVWIKKMVPVKELIPIYSGAELFVCPSVYEPFGIINLEAMACGTPVVASAVGGIPEVVEEGRTGRLVAFEPKDGGNPEPADPPAFSRGLASAVNELLDAPQRRREMGAAARQRVEQLFSWRAIADQTIQFYRELNSDENDGFRTAFARP